MADVNVCSEAGQWCVGPLVTQLGDVTCVNMAGKGGGHRGKTSCCWYKIPWTSLAWG